MFETASQSSSSQSGRPSGKTVKDVIVIGAGVGGLAAAVRLAAKGHRVTVLEKLERPGGKLNLLEDSGFRFDTGPSLVTLPWVFEELFAAAGERLEDHLELVRLEPVCKYFFSDGSGFDASADLPSMMRNLEQFSPGSGDDFMAFFGHAARAWRGSRKPFLESTINSPFDFVRGGVPWSDLSALAPWPTLNGLAKRFFRDKRLQQFVGRYATYTGSSPYKAPGTLSTVLYSEYAFGAWYLKGGLYSLAVALEKIAKKLGVKFEYNSRVTKILIEDFTAPIMPDKREIEISGVQLEDGQVLQADAIVCNADAAHLYENLLEPDLDDRKNKLEPSLSGFVMMLGVEGHTPGLEHHNIFFSSDYPLEFKRIFEDGRPAENPTIYVCISSKSDASQAPAGMENWFVLVNAPPTGRTDWNQEAAPYAQLILQSLAARGFDIRDRIRVQHQLTPADLESRYLTHRGGIYGSSSNTISSAFLRPKNRAKKVQGLYLASGSAHPGGGLPLVMLSGKLASDAFEQDLANQKI
jgi:phytoene desaturase